MLYKVTHIDEAGHRHRARVSAQHAGDALAQMDRVYGEARAGACLRMATTPVLRLVVRSNREFHSQFKGAVCGF
jgi:hypothetical protein